MTRSGPPPTATSDPHGEAERQAAELAALRRMLDASQGCFSLSFAVSNGSALRDYVIGQVRESFPEIRLVTVPAGTVDVFAVAVGESGGAKPAALFVVNLEASIPSERESQPALASLNASRELWERRFPCPVVFWLPEYAAALLSIHAGDFWRYRSHRFEFVSEQAGAVAGVADQFSGDLGAAATLTAEQKRYRIAELEQRIADAGDDPPDSLAQHACVWLSELGFLYDFIGDLDRAEQMHRKALRIYEKLGRMDGMANDYGNLGRMDGMANDYGNLGVIYGKRGDLEQAEQMLRKALEIDEQLGRMEGMAISLANLGRIAEQRGNVTKARELWTKARELFRQMDIPSEVAKVQDRLDRLPQETGPEPE